MFARKILAAAAGALVLGAAPASAVELVTYMQFFQTTGVKTFNYTPAGGGSTLTAGSAPGLAVALNFVKAPYVVGQTFMGSFVLSASSTSEVLFNGTTFEQPGWSGTYSFISGGINVLTISFGGGVLTRTTGTTPTASLLAECPCGITYTSDVFELPDGLKDFGFSMNALTGTAWSLVKAFDGNGYYGERFIANGTGTFAAVPEPTTWAMLIAGFGLVGLAARRRRHAAA